MAVVWNPVKRKAPPKGSVGLRQTTTEPAVSFGNHSISLEQEIPRDRTKALIKRLPSLRGEFKDVTVNFDEIDTIRSGGKPESVFLLTVTSANVQHAKSCLQTALQSIGLTSEASLGASSGVSSHFTAVLVPIPEDARGFLVGTNGANLKALLTIPGLRTAKLVAGGLQLSGDENSIQEAKLHLDIHLEYFNKITAI